VRATNRAGLHRVRQYRHLHQRRELTAVDHLCTTEAAAAGLTGSFSALVATGTASAISRFDSSGANWAVATASLSQARSGISQQASCSFVEGRGVVFTDDAAIGDQLSGALKAKGPIAGAQSRWPFAAIQIQQEPD